MKIKKILLSSVVATTLFTSSAQAGIPVVDGPALAQQVMSYIQMGLDYTEQVKQFSQMVKDTANFEKHMDELGIGMDIQEILGSTMQMINDVESIYNDITKIPQDFMDSYNQIVNACNFVEKQSAFFGIKISTIGNKISDKINRCVSVIKDKAAIDKTLAELKTKQQNTKDYDEYNKIGLEISNLQNAVAFIQNKENLKQMNTLTAFYDTYNSDDKSNPYSKASMTKDLQELSKAVKNPNNAKQAQALTNTILLKLLETTQRQYELTMNYSQTLSNLNSQSGVNNIVDEKDYQQELIKYEFDPDLAYGKYQKQMPKDEFGMPIFTLEKIK